MSRVAQVGVLVVAAGVPGPVRDAQDAGDQAQADPVGSHAPFFRWSWPGGQMSAAMPVPVAGRQPLAGPVAGDIELVVVEGGAGAPVAGDGAAAGGGGRAAFGAGACGGALVPPGVVEVGDRVVQLRADGLRVAADELADGHFAGADGAGDAGRAVAHHVQGAQPQPGASGVQAGTRRTVAGHGERRRRGRRGRRPSPGLQLVDRRAAVCERSMVISVSPPRRGDTGDEGVPDASCARSRGCG